VQKMSFVQQLEIKLVGVDQSCVALDTTLVDKVLHLQVAQKARDTVFNPENARFSRKVWLK
jgi:hypothetical protein